MEIVSYWRWFFVGAGGKPGFRRIVNAWLLLHLFLGSGLAYFVKKAPGEIANGVLFPVAAILVGLTFAWAGNAQAILQTVEIRKLSEHLEGGIYEYIYAFQTCILVILVTVSCWSLAAILPIANSELSIAVKIINGLISAWLYALFSLSLRSSWHAVIGAHSLLVLRIKLLSLE